MKLNNAIKACENAGGINKGDDRFFSIARELIPPQGREWSASDLPRGARIAA